MQLYNKTAFSLSLSLHHLPFYFYEEIKSRLPLPVEDDRQIKIS